MKVATTLAAFAILATFIVLVYSQIQNAKVVSTKEIGVIEAVSGGSWITRVQANGTNYPLVGEVTVTQGAMVVLQQRASGALYLCDAATRSNCFKVHSSEKQLGQQSASAK